MNSLFLYPILRVSVGVPIRWHLLAFSIRLLFLVGYFSQWLFYGVVSVKLLLYSSHNYFVASFNLSCPACCSSQRHLVAINPGLYILIGFLFACLSNQWATISYRRAFCCNTRFCSGSLKIKCLWLNPINVAICISFVCLQLFIALLLLSFLPMDSLRLMVGR